MMNQGAQSRHPEYQYLDILQEILDHGDKRMDRTGVGTLALFGRHMRFDVSKSVPRTHHPEDLLADRREGDAVDALGRAPTSANSSSKTCTIWTDWPLARYRRETGEEISQAENFEARVLGDDRAFAEEHGSIGRSYQVRCTVSWWRPLSPL